MITLEHSHPFLPAFRRPEPAVGANDEEAKAIAARVRATAGSFFWTMRLLPAPRREAMYALYAFCREVDDIVQGEASPALNLWLLSRWRSEIARLYGRRPRHLLTRALNEAVDRFNLRCGDFLAIIDGAEMDARRDIQAPSLAELDLYCARVAVAVGRHSVRVLGVESDAADRVADELGRAVQLTNILRNLAEDAERNRLYLPRELLWAHGIAAAAPRSVLSHSALESVCLDLAALAEQHYAAAQAEIAHCPRRAMRPAALMLAAYHALLHRLTARGWRRLSEPVGLPARRKAGLLARYGLVGR